MQKKRVISLLPAATEIICSLGAADQLVGRSHECDYPPAVLGLPACTSPRIDTAVSSAQIDAQARGQLEKSDSLYHLDLGLLRRLQPDVIVTQAQCEVCAVSLAEVEKAVSQWPGNHPQIVALSPTRIVHVWENIIEVAEAIGIAEQGREFLRTLKKRVVTVIERACIIQTRPKVACIEWIEPLMSAGNWVPEMVELAGGQNVLAESGKHSGYLTWGELKEADPDVIVVMPCGFNLTRTRAELSPLLNHPDWPGLRAVKSNRIYITDGHNFFNRPGPRIVESMEIMAEILHPDRFNYGHRGKNWEKV